MSAKKCKRHGHKWRRVRSAALDGLWECKRKNCNKEVYGD